MSKHIFASAVFVICIILCFIFVLVSFAKFSSSDSSYTSSIGKNWKNGPVSDVEAASLKCPEGKETIIGDIWEGTNEGCICEGKPITIGVCTNKDQKCKNIKAEDSLPFLMWKGVNFCGKRGPNYLEMKVSHDEKGCGDNYQSCGVVDSLLNYLCYPKNVDCPYNFMKNLKKNYPIPKDKKYTSINLGVNGNQGRMIFSNENKEGEIVTEFKIDDDTPCLSPDYRNFKHQPYILEKSYNKATCNLVAGEKTNKLFMKIDTISYTNLYNDNQIMHAVDNLDNFTKDYNYLNKNTNLYYRNYIGMKKECLEKLLENKTKEELILNIINIEDDINKHIRINVIGLAFAGIGIFMFFIFLLSAIFSGTYGDTGNLFNIIGIFIVSIPNLIIGLLLIFNTRNTNTDIKYMAHPGCTDSFTSSALNKFSYDIDTARNMLFAYTIFAIIGFIANILNIIFYKVENNNNSYNQLR